MTATNLETPWLTSFNAKCRELLADIERTRRQIRYSHAALEADQSGFHATAHAFRVLAVSEQYDLRVSDAEAFIEDQKEQDEAERHSA